MSKSLDKSGGHWSKVQKLKRRKSCQHYIKSVSYQAFSNNRRIRVSFCAMGISGQFK